MNKRGSRFASIFLAFGVALQPASSFARGNFRSVRGPSGTLSAPVVSRPFVPRAAVSFDNYPFVKESGFSQVPTLPIRSNQAEQSIAKKISAIKPAVQDLAEGKGSFGSDRTNGEKVMNFLLGEKNSAHSEPVFSERSVFELQDASRRAALPVVSVEASVDSLPEAGSISRTSRNGGVKWRPLFLFAGVGMALVVANLAIGSWILHSSDAIYIYVDPWVTDLEPLRALEPFEEKLAPMDLTAWYQQKESFPAAVIHYSGPYFEGAVEWAARFLGPMALIGTFGGLKWMVEREGEALRMEGTWRFVMSFLKWGVALGVLGVALNGADALAYGGVLDYIRINLPVISGFYSLGDFALYIGVLMLAVAFFPMMTVFFRNLGKAKV